MLKYRENDGSKDHAISGIHVVDIDSWLTFKNYLRQLDKPTVREKFDTVTIDTVSLLWDLCERYVCQQAGVKEISEIAWGKTICSACQ